MYVLVLVNERCAVRWSVVSGISDKHFGNGSFPKTFAAIFWRFIWRDSSVRYDGDVQQILNS